MGRYIFLTTLVVVMIVVQSLLYFFMVARVDRDRKDFVLTKDVFIDAVGTAVTNFLSSMVPAEEVPVKENSTLSTPSLVFVDTLSTWQTYSGNAGCEIDGVRYTVGDYTKFGLILLVDTGRVFCNSTNGVVIVRARSRQDVPPERPGLTGAQDDARL